jgi:hypothetical protein
MDLTTYGLALIPLVIAGGLIVLYLRKAGGGSADKAANKHAYQGVVKKDWVLTGRIDFATSDGGDNDAADADRPKEFKLLVEERRIVESIAGNDNLEIQWRLASLKEAKVVIGQYHKYLTEHGLIKAMAEDPAGAAAGAATVAPAAVAAAPIAADAPPEPASDAPAEPAERAVTSS